MTVTELRTLAATFCESKHVDDDLPLPTFLQWVRECSDDLAAVARRRVKTTTTWPGGLEFTLPVDLVELRELRYNNREVVEENLNTVAGTTTYNRWGDTIRFVSTIPLPAGPIEVSYYRRLLPLTAATHTPELPLQFHRLYALWGAARYWKFFGDEPQKEAALRQEYEVLKHQLDRHTLAEGGSRNFRMRMRW